MHVVPRVIAVLRHIHPSLACEASFSQSTKQSTYQHELGRHSRLRCNNRRISLLAVADGAAAETPPDGRDAVTRFTHSFRVRHQSVRNYYVAGVTFHKIGVIFLLLIEI